MANYAEKLPKMLFGEELRNALTCLPEYDTSIREADPGTRLLRLTDLYKVFLPGTMATEIYHKLYMMTSMSLSQKGTVSSVRQLNANHKWMNGGEFHGVATGATSATVIGASGIGKTTCIRKAMDMLGGIIEIEQPYRKIIPVLMVSTPFDCNYKGLLCQVLMAIDEALDTNYYEKSQKSTIEQAETEKALAFTVPQAAIDYVLCGGNGISEHKYRICEQYQKNEGKQENIKFLRDEYGIGGRSDAIPGSGYWEDHDGKGITISRDYGDPDGKFLLSWAKVEKRIGELIAADRYLNRAEKEHYPVFQAQIFTPMSRKTHSTAISTNLWRASRNLSARS